MEIQLKTRATFLVSLSILCLSMMLVACKPSTNAPKEEKKAEEG